MRRYRRVFRGRKRQEYKEMHHKEVAKNKEEAYDELYERTLRKEKRICTVC